MTQTILAILSALIVGLGMLVPTGQPARPDIEIDTTQEPLVWEHHQRWETSLSLTRRIHRHAERHGLPKTMAMRLVATESDFDSLAISHKGAVGLTQVLPSTAGLSTTELQDANTNLAVGFAYLSRMRDRFGNWHTALMAYNDGPTDVAKGSTYSKPYADKVMGL